MSRPPQHPAQPYDARDFLLCIYLLITTALMCAAAAAWHRFLEAGMVPQLYPLLAIPCALFVGAALLAPPLLSLQFTAVIVRRLALGQLLTTALFWLIGAVAASRGLTTDDWMIAGPLAGLALGLGWCAAVRRRRARWLLGSVAAATIAMGIRLWASIFFRDDLIGFALVWSLLCGMGFAFLVLDRADADAGAPIRLTPLSLSGATAALIAGFIAVSVGLAPCGWLDRPLGLSRCALYIRLDQSGDDSFYTSSISYTADGGALLIAGEASQGAGAVRAYSSQTGALLRELPTQAGVAQIGLIPGASQILAVDMAGRVSLWDAATGELLRQFAAHYTSKEFEPSFSADGRFARLYTEVWDLSSGTLVADKRTAQQISSQLLPNTRGSPAGNLRSPAGSLRVVFVPRTPGRPHPLLDSADYDVALLPAGAEPELEWIGVPKTPSALLAGPVSGTSDLAFSPDGALLAALSDASSFHTFLRVWRIADGAVLYDRQIGERAWASSLAWSPDSRSIALTDKGKSAVIIQVIP